MTLIKRLSALPQDDGCLVILGKKNSNFQLLGLSPTNNETVRSAIDNERNQIQVVQNGKNYIVLNKGEKGNRVSENEKFRKLGAGLIALFNDQKIKSVSLVDAFENEEHLLALAEGIALGNYQFLKYKIKKNKKNTLEQIFIVSKKTKEAAVN